MTHPDSIKLVNSFPTLLICDTIYKRNKYRILLLKIVGITSTNMTFSVTFANLSSNRTNDFEWPLSEVK